jgi:hypothetical protein
MREVDTRTRFCQAVCELAVTDLYGGAGNGREGIVLVKANAFVDGHGVWAGLVGYLALDDQLRRSSVEREGDRFFAGAK